MAQNLADIRYNIEKANRTDGRVQNLASYIDADLLKSIHRRMDKNKASGVDRVTKEEYEANLDDSLKKLVARMKHGTYRPNPTRRVYIPKDGSKKMRPLGISCYEDKLVENAVAQILMMVYEPKFYTCSYRFRPGKNCHMAVRDVINRIQHYNTSYVVEADIRSYFDTIPHDWLMRMLEHDIADKRFLEIVWRFLKAGVMDNGKYLDNECGSPQGNGTSPVLANVYLHYVLDNWFDVVVQRQCKGQCYLIRYCDDFVCCFQYKWEAEIFKLILPTPKLALKLCFVRSTP